MREARKVFYPLAWISIGVLFLCLIKKHWTPEWDSAYFIEIARSLVGGKGLTYLGYPAMKGSIGFPVLLSPIIWAWGLNFLALNILIVACALGSIWVAYRLLNQFLSKDFSMLIAWLSGISFLMMDRSTYIMSDIPYMFFSLLALFYLNRFLSADFSVKDGIIAGACLTLCLFIRPVGVGAFFGLLLYLAVVKNVRFKLKKLALITLLGIVPLIAWSLWPREPGKTIDANLKPLAEFVPYQQEYMRAEYDEPFSPRLDARVLISRIIKNSVYYGSQAFSIVTGRKFDTSVEFLRSALKNIREMPILGLSGFIALIVFVGFLGSLLAKRSFIDFYVLFYIGIQLLISAREPRYLLPVVPFVFYYFFEGIRTICRKISPLKARSLERVVAAAFLLFVSWSHLMHDVKLVVSIHKDPFYTTNDGAVHNQNFIDCIEWVKSHTSSDIKIISVQAPWVVLLAERWCVSFPWVNDEQTILNFIKNTDSGYLIVAPLIQNRQKYLLPIVKDHGELFREIYRSGDAKIFLIDKEKLKAL